MNIELLKNVNFDALPHHLKLQFDKVLGRFVEITPFVLCDKDAYHHFDTVYILTNDEDDNALDEDDLANLIELYGNGFLEGYNNFEKILASTPFLEAVEETKVYRIFSIVYNRANLFGKFPLIDGDAIFRISRESVYMYGKDVGLFIRAWDCILNNANVFEKMFQQKSSEASEPSLHPVKWEGEKIELLELFKALHLSGTISGVQTDLIKRFQAFFQTDLSNHSKGFNDLKIRNNGSETLFLDTLRMKLKQWINKESKR